MSTAGLLALFLLRGPEARSARRAKSCRASLATFSQTLSTQMGRAATVQNGQMDGLRKSIDDNLGRIQDQQRLAAKETRDTLEQKLDRLQQDNAAKLEQMRQTVDEKLQTTLEKRLSRIVQAGVRAARAGAQGPRRDAARWPPASATSSAC